MRNKQLEGKKGKKNTLVVELVSILAPLMKKQQLERVE